MPGSTAVICPNPNRDASCKAAMTLPSVVGWENALTSVQQACSSRINSSKGETTKAPFSAFFKAPEESTWREQAGPGPHPQDLDLWMCVQQTALGAPFAPVAMNSSQQAAPPRRQ
ncbi:hypothetical protein ATANTOWER_029664 [Ataeniobius toweri]|uniref:Uncharacterized protein n=1 Tax=Ataeniobius toweri TaxID=208326 RepID=A0ABU7AJQ1_9TELE|nr:hypothetical protein [Ataeniobius toweri]